MNASMSSAKFHQGISVGWLVSIAMAALIHCEYAERRRHCLQQALEASRRFDPRVQQQNGRRLWVALLEVGDRDSGREVNAAGDPIWPHLPMLGRNAWRTLVG
jgi:hypothetical protein